LISIGNDKVRHLEGIQEKFVGYIQGLRADCDWLSTKICKQESNRLLLCRLRPPAAGFGPEYFGGGDDDERTLHVDAEKSTVRIQHCQFQFNRVFEPSATISDVFEEVLQLT
jgi:hypothetical protein